MNAQHSVVLYGLLALTLTGCTAHDWPIDRKSAAPIHNVVATSVLPGEISITWELAPVEPATSDRIGILATYFDPIEGSMMERMASGDETSLVIPSTASVAGEYTFEVRSVSSTGDLGQINTVRATSLPMTKIYTPTDFRDLELTKDMVSTNAQEASEGPIENLVDGDVNNYFHTDWQRAWEELHYICIDLKSDNYGGSYLRIGYVPRPGNSSGAPKTARILTSANGSSWIVTAESTSYAMPAMTGDRVDGDYFLIPEGTRYIRFVPTSRHDGTNLEEMLGKEGESFFHMGELYLSKAYGRDVYDPEIAIKERIEANKQKRSEMKK